MCKDLRDRRSMRYCAEAGVSIVKKNEYCGDNVLL